MNRSSVLAFLLLLGCGNVQSSTAPDATGVDVDVDGARLECARFGHSGRRLHTEPDALQ